LRPNAENGGVLAQRALITGGAGFIGSHVTEAFLERGWSVDIIDDLSTGKRENVPPGATLHEFDIRSPEASRLVKNGSFDAVLHLAAQMDVRKSVADPANDASINILGTLNLLEAVRSSSAARGRFVFISTGGALYGEFVTPPNEETFPKDPESPYAISKLSAEYYMAYYSRVHGLDTTALRLGNVYGPRQDPHGEAGVVAIFCGRILDGRSLTIFGDGTQTRDYVYVRDVASAVVLAVTKELPKPGRIDARGFNIGTGTGTSVNELAQTLLRASGRSVPMEYAPHRPGEQMHSYLNVAKAGASLGWKPTVTLQQGLAETFTWFKARQRAPQPT
jgi:UDP-glucose 4-epimerase